MKQYKRAIQWFQNAVSAPATAISQFAIESYKKYLLVSLIESGKVEPLPPYTFQMVVRFVKSNKLKAYHDLESVMAKNSVQALQAVIERHQSTYVQDDNLPLVLRCVPALRRKIIVQLTESYLSLPLSDIVQHAHLASVDEAVSYLNELVTCQ